MNTKVLEYGKDKGNGIEDRPGEEQLTVSRNPRDDVSAWFSTPLDSPSSGTGIGAGVKVNTYFAKGRTGSRGPARLNLSPPSNTFVVAQPFSGYFRLLKNFGPEYYNSSSCNVPIGYGIAGELWSCSLLHLRVAVFSVPEVLKITPFLMGILMWMFFPILISQLTLGASSQIHHIPHRVAHVNPREITILWRRAQMSLFCRNYQGINVRTTYAVGLDVDVWGVIRDAGEMATIMLITQTMAMDIQS
ncbi:hypothetical protein IW261DRAFT_1418331 [Armillaria novae-zelandiae]|uniref:Uncharacterized protein n=1 Tax=Armillaria novae-zelandiae TaxID=153914 RepID=A0AA39UDJ8_9AGAR|nr:hypothetical protein IW261DRAFT_1418331 [Armillaria novae-zelandiae]